MSRKHTAAQEVAKHSDASIQRMTASRWAARAVACYARSRSYSGAGRVHWLDRATSYRDEALEHAALVGDAGRTVAKVQRRVDAARNKAERKSK